MSEYKLTKNDVLIINGKEITHFNEEDVVCDFGGNTNFYRLNIEVEKGSEADLQLKKLLRRRNNGM